MRAQRIHYVSGLILISFAALHLCNHAVGLFGAEAHIAYMQKLRTVYRHAFVESILLLCVGMQIATGIRLFFRKRKSATNGFKKLQLYTGLYMVFFLSVHVSAVLVGRTVLDLDTNYYFGVAGLNIFPLFLFFIPYYGLAIAAFFGHLSAVHYTKMKREIFGITTERQAKIILWSGVVFSVVVLYGLTDGFTGVEIPAEYRF